VLERLCMALVVATQAAWFGGLAYVIRQFVT
jgi:hypothetical protein